MNKRNYCYLLAGLLLLLVVLLWPKGIRHTADTYDNAYTYYTTYGNRMTFEPTSTTDGNISYATRAKRTSSGILFSNVGWKAVVKGTSGVVLQEIYYKMDGSYLKTVDIRTAEDGYEYSLYQVSLSDFKSRLSDSTKASLEAGTATIEFDACIIVKNNGVLSGGMTDAGISWGKVYTTYTDIVNAEFWSEDTQNNLKTYYDKEIEGLFCTLTLTKDSGIMSVQGAGTYCYGTQVHIYATPKSGKVFSKWKGDYSSSSQSAMITINKDMTIQATSAYRMLTLYYKRNYYPEDTTSVSQLLLVNLEGQIFLGRQWDEPGYSLVGWKSDPEGMAPEYELQAQASDAWIRSKWPTYYLYGHWKANKYTLCYDTGGAVAEWEEEVEYPDVISLPKWEPGQSGTSQQFLGWSLTSDRATLYQEEEVIAISELVTDLGLAYQDGARITFYAIWDSMPTLQAENLYVSLKKANEGMVTEEYLISHARARDPEDGELTNITLMDYCGDIYRQAEKEGYVYETFCAKDKNGNQVQKTIRVYLVDTTIYRESEVYGELRFISKDYLIDAEGNLVPREEGGLEENSRWRLEDELLDILKELLQ